MKLNSKIKINISLFNMEYDLFLVDERFQLLYVRTDIGCEGCVFLLPFCWDSCFASGVPFITFSVHLEAGGHEKMKVGMKLVPVLCLHSLPLLFNDS